ncbi:MULTISPECIES: cell division protein ZapE [unclassified Rhizobium]|uniref:cell division protein ZapE n=1 Tax=unclassified Rhizobium TaxID=2613769 RepID=UPI000DDC5A6C|nr:MULTISPECIES: cell division protein ZapE [unclassified Rhizobium]MBB3286627.1 cell division protein ZapE [Rhizobium sp. BK252]MBB3401179.1 cell division protein ZapE [Rhizobium sp. BK289]MBB3413757.1 cell division protein ZapE [Rhizobium sp. BK284]MBB3481644.1 cell division protein ZapE [Rhizobium sp. BK347]MDK4719763.1 cell division protein ZapE [Rhizobium sp. CNPSo 3968]
MQPMPDYALSVCEQLKALTASGSLQVDSAQMDVAKMLDRVLADLKRKRPAAKSSALGWMFAARKKSAETIKGLYIHGSVGRGKTMLMDMFFSMAPCQKKRRAHFFEFMADVHNRIAAQRLKFKNGETKQSDPIPPVAADLYAEAELLCFDEFTVTDIADAMILSRLFSELFSLGCVLIATSNVEPDNLYRDGLNRGLFLPFIDLLKKHVDVVTLDSPTDYRMEKLNSQPVYLTPLDQRADMAMDASWMQALHGRKAQPMEIPMKGRSIHVPLSVDRMARFSFADLCDAPLGPADFLTIAERFDTIFLDHVPKLGPDKRNQTKRFIILIDTLYDHNIRLYVSAAAMPEDLLEERRGTEGFEFDRTASRLFEMRSAEYLAQTPARRAAE